METASAGRERTMPAAVFLAGPGAGRVILPPILKTKALPVVPRGLASMKIAGFPDGTGPQGDRKSSPCFEAAIFTGIAPIMCIFSTGYAASNFYGAAPWNRMTLHVSTDFPLEANFRSARWQPSHDIDALSLFSKKQLPEHVRHV
jgi:hypothetical protein